MVIQVKVLITDQSSRLQVFDDGVLSDWQMELIATQNEPVVDGVAHQVDAGPHDKSDDADVDCRARQRLWTALNQLMTGHDAFCTWYRNISLKQIWGLDTAWSYIKLKVNTVTNSKFMAWIYKLLIVYTKRDLELQLKKVPKTPDLLYFAYYSLDSRFKHKKVQKKIHLDK